MKRLSILFAIVLLSLCAVAQQKASEDKTAAAADETPGIQDNSFLIEEAYNQEPGIVQHINFLTHTFHGNDWLYTFTQEWPVGGIKNQLSYTVAGTHSSDFPGSGGGWGDTAINYRYQLVGSGETRLAISPRLSVLLPTGNSRYGRGYGGTGLQTLLPVSLVINKWLVTHWNVGATWVPNMRNELGEHADANGYMFGQSTIFLPSKRFNVMMETVWTGNESVVSPGKTQRANDLLLSPGVRWAYNFKNGLQIVPGVAFPMGAGPSAGNNAFILYVSFEHPLAFLKKK